MSGRISMLDDDATGDRPRTVEEILAAAHAIMRLGGRSPAPGSLQHPDLAEATGWEPYDLAPILTGDWIIPGPELYERNDGVNLLYRGRCHAFNGEPESGKSWAAQHATSQVLANGGRVSYLDFEDSAPAVCGRIVALGVDPDRIIDGLSYFNIDQPFSIEGALAMDHALDTWPPELAVIDGVTEAMVLLGFDPHSNADVAKFMSVLPRRLARTGAATVMIDHVVKDRENRGRWAIGAQHKMAAIDGAAYTFECVQPFGRGKEGRANIICTKDRPGYIRQYGVGATVASFRLVSWPDEKVDATLEAPATSAGGGFQPTTLMERLSRYVELNPGLTKNALGVAVAGRREVLLFALELLVKDGYVEVRPGPRRSQCHHSVRPYREEGDADETPDF